jgi:hypothetical protein
MLQDYKDFAEYIAMHYPWAGKIVEVGVGKEFSVVEELRKKTGADIVAVDIQGGAPMRDDITHPTMQVYRGAGLIYSIRPNPELYPYLLEVARRVGADLIIRPFPLDPPLRGGKLVNYKKSTFYLIRGKSNYI